MILFPSNRQQPAKERNRYAVVGGWLGEVL
jgi:hypothetical protein